MTYTINGLGYASEWLSWSLIADKAHSCNTTK